MRPVFFATLILAVAILAFFWPALLGGRVLLPADNLFLNPPWSAFAAQQGVSVPHNHLLADMILENYAWKRFARDELAAGALPLWNPAIFGGEPFLAAGQQALLYPFSILFLILPVASAYAWYTALHLLLGGLFTYAYLRLIGASPVGGLVSALTFAFAGFLVVSLIWPMVVGVVIWLPALLALIELFIRGIESAGRTTDDRRPTTASAISLATAAGYHRLPILILGSVAVGLQVLSGHLEYSFYLLFVLAFYTAVRLGCLLWRARRPAGAIVAGVALLGMVGLGLALAAVQILPFVELMGSNYRVGLVTYQDVAGWALPKARLLTFLVPDAFGNPAQHSYLDVVAGQVRDIARNSLGQPVRFVEVEPARYKNYVEGAGYLGILPLLLALVALLVRRDRFTMIFGALALLSLLLAFGTPLYRLLWMLPGFDQLHSPFRWLFPYSFAVSVLAGLGATALTEGEKETGGKGEKGRDARVGLVPRFPFSPGGEGGGGVTLSPFPLFPFPSSAGGVVGLAALLGGAAVLGLLVLSRILAAHTVELADRFLAARPAFAAAFESGQMLYSYEFAKFLLFGIFLFLSGLTLLSFRRFAGYPAGGPFRPFPFFPLATVGLVVADLFLFGSGFNTFAEPRLLEFRPPAVEFLRQDREVFRVASFGHEDLLTPNTAMLSELQDSRGYDSIILQQYVEFWSLMERPEGLLYNRISKLIDPRSLRSPLLDLLNVKYVVSAGELDVPGFSLAYRGEVLIYRNDRVLPRAFVVSTAIPTLGRDEELHRTGDPSFDPRRAVVLAGSLPEGWSAGGGESPGSARIDRYQPNEVTITAELTHRGWLVLSDNHAAGWRVEVDGRESPLYRANATFRATPMEPGRHLVVFRYRPAGLQAGAYVSFLAAAALVLGAGVWAWRRFYREAEGASTIRRILKNSAAPMVFQLVNKGLDFAFAVFMIRTLGPEDVGKYVLAVVIFGYFSVFSDFGLATLLTRDVARDPTLARRYLANTVSLRLWLTLASVPLLLAVVGLYAWQFGLTTDTALATLILAGSLLPSGLAAALSSVFSAHEKMEYPAAVTTVTTLAKVCLGTMALLLGWGIVGLAVVAVLTSVLTALVLFVMVRSTFFRPGWEVDFALQRRMAGESYPFMLNNLLSGLFFRVDVMLLKPMKGDEANGLYTTAYRFIDGLNIIPSFFTLAIFPVMARYAETARDSLVRGYLLALKALLIVSFPLAVAIAVLADRIILLFFGEDFRGSILALQVLIWFLPFSYVNSVTHYVLIALNQQRFLTIAFAVGVSFNLVANLILIPPLGYIGAAVTTILSEIVLLIPFFYAMRRHLMPVPIGGLAWRPAVASACMGLLLWRLHDTSVLLSLPLAAAAYLGLLMALGTFDEQDRRLLRQLRGT